jgi:hypothetical protein
VTALRRVERWIFASGSGRRLAAIRIGLCSILAFRLNRGLYLDMAGQPKALYRPLSFMHLFGSMPSRGVAQTVQVAGVTLAVLAAAGLLGRVTLPGAWACGIFLNGMATSIGKVVHNDVLLLLAMVPLLAAPASEWWSLDSTWKKRSERRKEVSARYGWPVRTAMVVTAGGYFLTGLAKLVTSGPAWALSSNLRWVLYTSSDARAVPNALAIFIADRPLLAHALAAMTLIVELGFPIVLWRPRAAWFFVPAAIGLHAAIRVSMGLDYSAWAATALVVFTNWPAAVDRVRTRHVTSLLTDVQPHPV